MQGAWRLREDDRPVETGDKVPEPVGQADIDGQLAHCVWEILLLLRPETRWVHQALGLFFSNTLAL